MGCILASSGSRLTYPFSLYRPFPFWERSQIDMLSSRGLLSKSVPKPSAQLQLLYGASIVIFKPIQVEGLDVPLARLPDAFFGSQFQVIGEAKESIPERVLLLCSPVGDTAPDLGTVDVDSLSIAWRFAKVLRLSLP